MLSKIDEKIASTLRFSKYFLFI